jgi:hypothetical protein
MWTKERIQHLLNTSDRAVEKAMVAIYDRQTLDEKATDHTRHDNMVGFRSNHASKGSYYARWVMSGRKLTGHHLTNARKIALQYHRQLCEIANSKTIEPTVLSQESLREPPVGTWASVARMMSQGDDSGFDWDRWKDEMKEAQF